MRVCLSYLGCKLNLAEVEQLGHALRAAGHVVVGRVEEADVHLINSCAVTATAAQQSRQRARRGPRQSPGLLTVLTGCYATASAAEAAALAGVDLVVPNAGKAGLVAALEELAARRGLPALEPSPCVPALGHARATVKIGDGCDYRCAFCIIPLLRGREVSRPLADVVAEVAARVAEGAPEIVLTGVQISDYRCEEGGLYELVGRLLALPGLRRLRLTSIAPWDLDHRLVGLWRDPRLCRHVHLSLQSGCSATLRRMRRPYTAAEFAAARGTLVAAVPTMAITTDVIVGFPGETAAEHAESLRFVAAQDFARVHVFPYSSRPGTAAAGFPDPVAAATIGRRQGEMQALATAAARTFAGRFVGARLEVLWETCRDGVWQGLTDNYLRVRGRLPGALRQRVSTVQITAVDAEGGAWAEAA